ncbi:hypothetical protein LJ737_16275 [Hymenobacter sp. 15J16-1T3B]|uniref:hypothetical protein n=1 Tax=Hymenobacter sp. 15J16-1T3B TaxID=2886941 RepID=UPI001D11BCAF|nr:hypothetical protein [Hymenobacter sp. 15J16-1T3B]MCC3158802.1 hypothetical protein [Hymenobacter sp. 15J16-1T3B]
MTNLVVLSYGSQKEYRRAVLAVLSFFSFYDAQSPLPEVNVIIYTDRSDYFEQFLGDVPVQYVILTPEQQTAMMGTVGYRHRIKAVVVGDTLVQHPADNLLFFDSDTFFVKHPGPLLASIRPGVDVMHTVEFTFNDIATQPLPHDKTVADFVRMMEQEPFQTTRGAERFSGTQQCWNSGVLGLAPSVAAYLPDVYQLIDHLYANSHWHIIEQIAFSLVLQTRDQILPAIDYVYHYWEGDKKVAADALLTEAIDGRFAALPYADKLAVVRQLVERLPKAIATYLSEHAEIGLKQDAITFFNANRFGPAYRAALAYLLKVPADRKFLKDVLYHTKRGLTQRG